MRTWARRLAYGADRVIRGRGTGLILAYHRVADESSDPFGLCVRPDHFEEHVDVIERLGSPAPVFEMARGVRDGSLSHRSIGITFDDAYVDVLESAVPVLRRRGVPATVFITVGSGGREREFWWDELEGVLLQPGPLPDVLELEIDGGRRWSLGADAQDGLPSGSASTWRLDDDLVPSIRHAVFREIYYLLRPLAHEARSGVMDQLVAWAGQSGSQVRPNRRVMTAEEVADMTGEGLIEAGAHTVKHVDLTSQTSEVRRAELTRSKEELERWTGRQVDGFAYPYGRYDAESAAAVGAAGFAFGCAGDHRVVRPGDDPLILPRVDVPPGDGAALALLIRQYMG
jgi:peptidoglycan/xylan/chitin deacetylase (PgdA/CDA1 family)